MKCIACGEELAGDSVFCPFCGQKIEAEPELKEKTAEEQTERTCIHCGGKLNSESVFCPNCGEKVEIEPEIVPTAAKTCTNCGTMVSAETEVCPGCGNQLDENGTALGRICGSCGYRMSVSANFCEKCGTRFELPRAEKNSDVDPVIPIQDTKKGPRILVFAKGEAAKEALDAGADFVGGEELAERIVKENWLDFDVVIAHPIMMGIVGRLGRELGSAGLMPRAGDGMVTADVAQTVRRIRNGEIEIPDRKINPSCENDDAVHKLAYTKTCPQCGAEIAEGNRFCTVCGYHLDADTDSADQSGDRCIKKVYSVDLISVGNEKMKVIAAIRRDTGIGLAEAKKVTECCAGPAHSENIIVYSDKSRAISLKKTLEQLGAIVSITEKALPRYPDISDVELEAAKENGGTQVILCSIHGSQEKVIYVIRCATGMEYEDAKKIADQFSDKSTEVRAVIATYTNEVQAEALVEAFEKAEAYAVAQRIKSPSDEAQQKQIPQKKNCPKCGAELAEGNRFCTACGHDFSAVPSSPTVQKPQEKTCPQCGKVMAENDRFCTTCGCDSNAATPSPAEKVPKKTCPKCGAEASDGNRFCTQCGHDFNAVAPGQEPPKKIFPNCGAEKAEGSTYCTNCGPGMVKAEHGIFDTLLKKGKKWAKQNGMFLNAEEKNRVAQAEAELIRRFATGKLVEAYVYTIVNTDWMVRSQGKKDTGSRTVVISHEGVNVKWEEMEWVKVTENGYQKETQKVVSKKNVMYWFTQSGYQNLTGYTSNIVLDDSTGEHVQIGKDRMCELLGMVIVDQLKEKLPQCSFYEKGGRCFSYRVAEPECTTGF